MQYYGGFHTLEPHAEAIYPSSLASNGYVYWSSQSLERSSSKPQSAEATLKVEFPSVDWHFLQSVYGWAALQYQAWARGHLLIQADSTILLLLYADNVLEYLIDDKPYFGGDFYAYRKAPVVLRLTPGLHKIDIRLIRDVRSTGADNEPEVTTVLKVVQAEGGLTLEEGNLVVSDIINGNIASPIASLPVRNESQHWIQVLSVNVEAADFVNVKAGCSSTLIDEAPLPIAPGQTAPLAFRVQFKHTLDHPIEITFVITYAFTDQPERYLRSCFSHRFALACLHDPHKLTFLHPSGIVSYAILRAPSDKVCRDVDLKSRLPVLLGLHGAGLEADSDRMRKALAPLSNLPAWVLFPSGVTSWSADDWREYLSPWSQRVC